MFVRNVTERWDKVFKTWIFLHMAINLLFFQMTTNGELTVPSETQSKETFHLNMENIGMNELNDNESEKTLGAILKFDGSVQHESMLNGNSTKIQSNQDMELRTGFEKQHTESVKKPWPVWKTLQPDDVETDKDLAYLQKYYLLPPRSKDCDNIKAPGLDYTIVTAVIDLNREQWPHFRRQFLKYLYYAVQMLNLHAPMVIYVDEKAVDFVEYHRQGKEHFTRIIPTSIRDLEYYKYHDKIQEVMSSEQFKRNHTMLGHPEGFSPDYNILMNSKLSMIYSASERNYFSTNYFYWMDIGYGHGEDVFPTSCLWSPNAIMNNVHQITYIELNALSSLKSIDDLYKKFLPPFLNGAFFGGPKISIKRYYFLHRDVFLRFLEEGKVDDDQTLAVACYFEKPLLFNIVTGWWYDAFTLFK